MDILWEELTRGLGDSRQLIQVLSRLFASILFGATIGFQRELVGKPAGIKTHILVTLGTTLFVLSCSVFAMNSDGLSRVIQGIVTGIGFIGTGSILKINAERDIQGLTTAASVWMAAAIGVTVGLGLLGIALIATILTLIILTVVSSLEKKFAYKVTEKNNLSNEKL